ncbi:MAG: hypothetical protein KDE58_29885, partial [Caldilineaceae bacterium]|nr:hypothetical protein [Caldilineaceae bacterium]
VGQREQNSFGQAFSVVCQSVTEPTVDVNSNAQTGCVSLWGRVSCLLVVAPKGSPQIHHRLPDLTIRQERFSPPN